MDADLGFAWDASPVPEFLNAGGRERALFRFHRALPQAVWEAARFEGSPYTLPEVQTLIDGVTVGGRSRADEALVLGLIDSARYLRDSVREETFTLGKQASDTLHGLIASSEAIEAGHFRGEGKVLGGDYVHLGEHGTFSAPEPGPDGEHLRDLYTRGLGKIAAHAGGDPGMEAVLYFAFATLNQFYFDGNKRTARWMMNGHLMMHGLDPIGVPVTRQLDWNQRLLHLFLHRDATPLLTMLAECQFERIHRAAPGPTVGGGLK